MEHFDQRIRICTSAEGVRLAYATSGAPLVKAANHLTRLEHDWPVWSHWRVRELGHHLILYLENFFPKIRI